MLRIVIKAHDFLWERCRIFTDISKFDIIRQHIANRLQELDKIEEGITVEVDLGRKAKSILNKTLDENAKAWIDTSLKLPEIETNDISYEEKLLLQPEYVYHLYKLLPVLTTTLERFSEHLNLHLDVLQGIKQAFNNFNSNLKEFNSNLKIQKYLFVSLLLSALAMTIIMILRWLL